MNFSGITVVRRSFYIFPSQTRTRARTRPIFTEQDEKADRQIEEKWKKNIHITCTTMGIIHLKKKGTSKYKRQFQGKDAVPSILKL